MNHDQRRAAYSQQRKSLTAESRKSAVSKRMNRPHKLDAATRGYEKIHALIDRFKP